MIKFTKMQALGNDFVVIEGVALPSELIRKVAHRRLGVGCDQIIFYQKKSDSNVDVQFYNSDGTVAGACGNGSRALALLLCQDGRITLKTQDRELPCVVQGDKITVDMGICEIDASHDHGSLDASFWIMASIGNPHRIAFVDRLESYDIDLVGKSFPTENVSLAQVTDSGIVVKTYERGAGYTGACGTAACAVAAIAMKYGQSSPVIIQQQGGNLTIAVEGDRIQMSGTAEIVFVGEITL